MEQQDYFARLGLPRRFSIDAAELERAYLALSRAIHPDYHLAGSDAELSASQELSASLNAAYKTLKEPFSRADYLLQCEGGPSASEYKQLPSDFLSEMLEAREEIEQAQGDPAAIERLDRDFQSRANRLLQQIQATFEDRAALPANDLKGPNLLIRIRGLLNASKYIRGLIRDLHSE